MTWLLALPLRLKLWGLGIGITLLALGGLWAAWRVARADARKAEARSAALQAARKAQLRIITKQSELRERARIVREDLAARTQRDLFEDQGWGP
jgi:hypothetical protein